MLQIVGDLAAILGELDHDLLVQPHIHLGRVLHVAGVMELLGELLARGLAFGVGVRPGGERAVEVTASPRSST